MAFFNKIETIMVLWFLEPLKTLREEGGQPPFSPNVIFEKPLKP